MLRNHVEAFLCLGGDVLIDLFGNSGIFALPLG